MWAMTQPPVRQCIPACPQQVKALCVAKHTVSCDMASARDLAMQRLQGRQVATRAQKQKKAQRKRTRQPEHSGGDEAARAEASREPSADRQQPTSTSGKPIGWTFLPRENERWQPDEEPATVPPQVCGVASARESSCACHCMCAPDCYRLRKHCQQSMRELPLVCVGCDVRLEGTQPWRCGSACVSCTHPRTLGQEGPAVIVDLVGGGGGELSGVPRN